MRCLCCNKLIKETDKNYNNKWHSSCVKKFFGVSNLPKLDINDETLELLAINNTNKGLTIPGVQKKLSLHLSNDKNPRLTLINHPTGYILKPQSDDYEFLPEAEFLIMQMAKVSNISTVPNALILIGDNHDKYAYITKRIDRIIEHGITYKLAMEDFAQLDQRLTIDKYKGSYERCAKIIDKYSINSGLDLSNLFYLLLFCFVTGNSDMHLKNFSLIETAPFSKKYKLSPAYDLLPVNILLPEDNEEFALSLNGKKKNIKRNDFIKYAELIGINKISAEKMINKIISLKEKYISMCKESFLPINYKEALESLICKRILLLKKSN